ncbi:MAG: heavy metal-binding domain-containing protein [Roseiarcus sp.]
MQVSHTNKLEGGRGHHSIGRIKGSSGWRAVDAPVAEADRVAAVRALIREAEEYDADAIVGLDFEVEGVKRTDFDGVSLQRVAATGIAVKFDEAA